MFNIEIKYISKNGNISSALTIQNLVELIKMVKRIFLSTRYENECGLLVKIKTNKRKILFTILLISLLKF